MDQRPGMCHFAKFYQYWSKQLRNITVFFHDDDWKIVTPIAAVTVAMTPLHLIKLPANNSGVYEARMCRTGVNQY